MKRFWDMLVKKPIVLWLVVLLLYAILSTLGYPVYYLFPKGDTGKLYAETSVRLIIFAVFVIILWRVNWIGISGVSRKGNWRAWLIAMFALLYLLPTKLYAFTGNISFNFGNAEVFLGNLANYFAGAMVEEIMYRGIILTALVLVWGNSRAGLAKALVVSSLMFGALHLLNLINTPVLEVLIQVVVVIIPGFFYAVLVQIGGSIWPAVVVHWLTNSVVNIQLSYMSDYEVQMSNWLISGLLMLPLLVATIILFNRFVRVKSKSFTLS